jgi:long-chain acyl-CoA synthetase
VELRPGDRIALLVPGSTAYVDLVIGLLAAGMFPVPLDPRLTERELDDVLAYVEPRLVVDSQEQVESMVEHTPARFRRGLPRGRPMHLTSGSTGSPKGVHSGVLPEAQAQRLLDEERELWGFRETDVNLVLSPLHHSAPLRFAIGTVLAGGRLAGLDGHGQRKGLDPAVVTTTIDRERPTTMFCVPTHLQRLFAYWDREGVPDLSCFRLVAHAGAPCPPAVKRRMIELFPDGSTWEFYGSTEGQFTACRSEEWLRRPGTVGRARPGRELLLDEDGTIWCVVPEHSRFTYWNAPEKTAAAWRDTEHGPAFTVGDLGRLDDDGYLFLGGRREDLVISGGVNVYPVEVENALREHRGVEDVAVYGVDDPDWGQRVCAAYVGSARPDELTAYARGRLAPAKRPKEYLRVDALPRTATGKLRRTELGASG